MTWVKNIFYFCMTVILISALAGLAIFYFYGQDLPDYTQLKKYDPPVLTRLFSKEGDVFAEYAREKRIFVPISSIPSQVIKTFLVVEDEHFYDHFGLSISGIIRALLNNLKNKITGQKGLMGGSTITQQVAKNFLLTNDRTLTRKIKEAILSIRIERALPKSKILELYLNEIYFGSSNYGIAAAALNYFNKPLNELSIAETAYLASLPKAPNNYHPIRNKQAAIARRNWVISRMQEEKLITAEQARSAMQEDLTIRRSNIIKGIDAQFFAEDVRRFIADRYGAQTLYEEGLVVHTTLNSFYQKLADEALRNGLISFDRKKGWRGPIQTISLENWPAQLQNVNAPLYVESWRLAVVLSTSKDKATIGFKDKTIGTIPLHSLKWARQQIILKNGKTTLGKKIGKVQDVLNSGQVIYVSKSGKPDGNDYQLQQLPEIEGAIVVMDPHTGKVLAMDGGLSFARSQFNRASQALRQTGSAFKPFTYLAAFEKGYSPTSLILDAPFVYESAPGQPLWTPQNIEKKFFGINTLRTALERSMNTTVVRLAHAIGMAPIASVARRFGIYENLPPYLSAVLGSEETTLLQFTAAYSMLANGGIRVTPYLIEHIQDRQGKTIYRQDNRTCPSCASTPPTADFAPHLESKKIRIADSISVYQIVSILEGVGIRGTGRRVKPKDHIIAMKTGTSNDYKDAWTFGFTKDLVVGVFVGYDQPRSMGRFNTGGSVAGPIFKEFMEKALAGQKSQPFKVPPKTKFIRINRLNGQRAKTSDKHSIIEAFKPNQNPNPETINASSTLSNDIVSGIY
ncbi:MAG: penicillin-binding protein [Rickettsiales bacterium]|nr:penicillin-binding protein [Rickettsiales bacterium]|tara:strand:+ start:13461 stop:15851 length:2391 start_codon:yes stop_codon:yes gene_type:complete